MLRRTKFPILAVVVTLALGGLTSACPDRAEVIDQVGGAPGRQVDDARLRIKATEEKLKHNVDGAAKIE